MLSLESFVHRGALADIIARWMVNRPKAGDVLRLKTIVNFNYYATRLWLIHLAKKLLTDIHGAAPRHFAIHTKGELKDFAVEHLDTEGPRVQEMVARYRRFPEDFYRETPIDGVIYVQETQGAPRFIGSSRVKRFRRVSEKGARRIVDYVFGRMLAGADALAEGRARSLGIPKSELFTTPGEMEDEFKHAERRVLKSIKQGTIQEQLPVLGIPDVAGIKVIVDEEGYQRLLRLIDSESCFALLEEERHSGAYNAVNLKLRYRLPKDVLLAEPPSGGYLQVLSFRGFNPDRVPDRYRKFLETAEDEVDLEIIAASFEEFLESEIGRSMHEERIISQRAGQDYNGHVATNTRYLMEYIFALCLSPSTLDIAEVPIKLWVKYMPDMIERVVQSLFIPDDFFFDSFAVQASDTK